MDDGYTAAPRTAVLGAGRVFYGWIIVGIAMLTTFASGPGQSYLFSVFIDPIIADTGMSRTEISTPVSYTHLTLPTSDLV